MSFSSLARLLFCGAVVCACAHQPWPEPPPVDQRVFLSEHAAWRFKRQQVVRDNWVGLAGLCCSLSERRTAFGTDSALPIVLAGSGPPRGAWHVRATRSGRVCRAGGARSPPRGDNRAIRLRPSRYRPTTIRVPMNFVLGRTAFWIHVVEDRYYVRAAIRRMLISLRSGCRRNYEPTPGGASPHGSYPTKRPRKLRIADIVRR